MNNLNTFNWGLIMSRKKYQLALDYLINNPDNPVISQNTFKEITGVSSRTTFYNFLDYLKESGYILSIQKKGRTAFYRIENLTTISSYQELSTDDYYKYLITEVLERNTSGMLIENPASRSMRRNYSSTQSFSANNYKYFLDQLYFLDDNTYENLPINSIPIGIKETKLRELLQDLIKEDKIKSTNLGKDGILYQIKDHNNILCCDNEDLSNIYNNLRILPHGHKNYSLLNSIKDKIALELNLINELPSQNFIIYGKKYQSYTNIIDDLSVLQNADYIHKTIGLTYYKDEILTQTLFDVGAIVYSSISDEIYVLGKEKITSNDLGYYSYLPLSSITAAISQNKTNLEYGSEVYTNLINNMLDISVDRPSKISANVIVDYLPTERKIKTLCRNRGTVGQYTIHHDGVKKIKSITYTDRISDVNNIKSYFLGYGRACTVSEPEFLRNEIIAELKEALEQYKQEGFDVN